VNGRPFPDDSLIASAAPAARRLGLASIADRIVNPRPEESGSSLPEPGGSGLGEALDPDVLIATAGERLDLLGRGFDVGAVREEFDAWAAGLSDRPVRFDVSHGLRRQSEDGRWLPVSTLYMSAESLPLPITPADACGQASNNTAGIVVEGFDPPWLVERVYEATNDSPDGYRPELFVVQHDPGEFLDGLSLAYSDGLFTDVRVNWYIGHGATRSLARALTDRMGVILPAHLLVTPGLVSKCEPRVADTIRAAHAEQAREQDVRLTRVRSPAGRRSLADWRDRYDEATGDGGRACEKLRVLLPTTRRSTYLRHSAHDLADGFRRLGHHAEIFETDLDHHLPSSLGLLRHLDRFSPDLIVVANDTRARLARLLPEHVPYVCHLMDPLEHLFDDAMGASQGPTDFVVGHLYTPLFRRHGYRAENARFAFVPASASKFHDGPVDEVLSRELACDVAYISHQSESPDQMHERLCAAFGDQPRLLALMNEARRRIGETFDPDVGAEPISAARSIDPHALSLELVDGDSARGERLARMYVAPMAERFARHRVLEWAAEIACRRGWSLRLYGRGWENHPTLCVFAAGLLPHDEALRAAYRSARACLHVSRLTNSHQRVFECALSCGLMLRRGPSPDFQAMHAAFYQTLGRESTPERLSPKSAIRRYNRKRIPCLYGRHLDPLVLRPEWVPPRHRRPEYVYTSGEYIGVQFKSWPSMPMMAYADAGLGNPCETMFTDAASLESLLERAIHDDAWRSLQAADHRRYALSHATYDVLAGGMISLVTERLGEVVAEQKKMSTDSVAGIVAEKVQLVGASHP